MATRPLFATLAAAAALALNLVEPTCWSAGTRGSACPPGSWAASRSDRSTELLMVIGASPALARDTSDMAPDLTNIPAPRPPKINPRLPSIFIASDSTAARGAGASQQGWGVPFASYFNPAKVNVVNCARGGRSSRTFITEGLWARLLALVKPGDIVLIQFGHNDAGLINDRLRARGSLPGLGNETRKIHNLQTGKPEVVHTFGWYMSKMIADTRAKGATPIVLSTTVRDIWHHGKVERGPGHYLEWSTEVAKVNHAEFIDVTDIVADKYDAMGEKKVKALYQRDHTHFNAVGADLHAAVVVAGLKGLHPDPVRGWLSAKGRAVAPIAHEVEP